ncbi:hypothetical protein E4U48_001780 [Claviceps purpurea]|nr:hypothetical protein E4U25_001292 [Claviceps purpurea]KAG6276114.1 hypothetical protein E4U48_001780 [Claviceps purpurea]
MAQYVHSQALAMVLENLQKARERLKPSHREDGASFTRSAVLTNSNNTENRCCDDCVCNDDYTACMGGRATTDTFLSLAF